MTTVGCRSEIEMSGGLFFSFFSTFPGQYPARVRTSPQQSTMGVREKLNKKHGLRETEREKVKQSQQQKVKLGMSLVKARCRAICVAKIARVTPTEWWAFLPSRAMRIEAKISRQCSLMCLFTSRLPAAGTVNSMPVKTCYFFFYFSLSAGMPMFWSSKARFKMHLLKYSCFMNEKKNYIQTNIRITTVFYDFLSV